MDAKTVMELRSMTGAGVLDAKKALEDAGGDLSKAADALRKKGQAKAAKKSDRETREGLVGSYIHTNGKMGVLVAVACETDFVARNPDFKTLVADIAMHIAAANPDYVAPEDVPADVVAKEREIAAPQVIGKPPEIMEKIITGKLDKFYADHCLLRQEFVKDDTVTVQQRIEQTIAKVGENIRVVRFARFVL